MTSIYSRIPGTRRTLIGKDTLWIADDHLLAVHSNRISEQYQRIYFKDIQALVVEEPEHSRRKLVLGALLGVSAAAVGALGYSGHYIIAALILPLPIVPLSMLVFMAQCRCYAVTALGRYKLAALKRKESLQRALALLTPSILEAQKKEEPPAVPGPSEML